MKVDISLLIVFPVWAAKINKILYLMILASGKMNLAILFIDQKLFDYASIRSNNFGDIVTAGICQLGDIKNFTDPFPDVSLDNESCRSSAHAILLEQSGYSPVE